LDAEATRFSAALLCDVHLDDIADVSGAATVSEAYDWKEAVVDHGKHLLATDSTRYRKFIVSGNIRPFQHTWQDTTVRYIKHGYEHPVLDTSHKVVKAKRRAQIASAKVIVSGMAKRPTAVWDDEGIAAGKSTVIVIPKVSDDGPFIAALLNSRFVADLYKVMFGALSLAGGYMRFGPPQLKALPVPQASSEEKSELARLVHMMINQEDATDRARESMDALVEKLYTRPLECTSTAKKV